MSKKLLLGLLALATAQTAAVAQHRPGPFHINRAQLRAATPAPIDRNKKALDNDGPVRTNHIASNRPAAVPVPSWGIGIGQTVYDLQTNRAAGDRVHANSNGSVSATWTMMCDFGSAPNYPKRGTGYSYSAAGGTSPGSWNTSTLCGPTFRYGISSQKTGWPEVMEVNGQEVVLAHTAAGGLGITRRTLGSGAWSTTTILPWTADINGEGGNGTWPRAVASGNYIHAIYCSNVSVPAGTPAPTQPSLGDIANPMVYARSTDGGLTWDMQNYLLPGLDSSLIPNGGGDTYSISANGSTVAIVTGSFGDPMVMWKSTDNGTTWTQKIMQPGDKQISSLDTVTLVSGSDTVGFRTSDGAYSVVVDNSGKVHVFTGATLLSATATHDPSHPFQIGTTYFPGLAQWLLYWNDGELNNMRPQPIASVEDYVPPGATFNTVATGSATTTQWYGNTGRVSMPTAAIDGNGNVYAIYASVVAGTASDNGTPTDQAFSDLYMIKGTNNGGTILWNDPLNISRDLRGVPGGAASTGEESVFPSADHMIGTNNMLHYTWMSDYEPGTSLQPSTGADTEGDNAIAYDAIDVSTPPYVVQSPQPYTLNTVGLHHDVTQYVNAATVTPNPTTGKAQLNLNLKQDARVRVAVRNVLGQEVMQLQPSALRSGDNVLNLDLSNVRPGVYFCTMTTDKFTLTQRVVKN